MADDLVKLDNLVKSQNGISHIASYEKAATDCDKKSINNGKLNCKVADVSTLKISIKASTSPCKQRKKVILNRDSLVKHSNDKLNFTESAESTCGKSVEENSDIYFIDNDNSTKYNKTSSTNLTKERIEEKLLHMINCGSEKTSEEARNLLSKVYALKESDSNTVLECELASKSKDLTIRNFSNMVELLTDSTIKYVSIYCVFKKI